jgi:hypothetical protein
MTLQAETRRIAGRLERRAAQNLDSDDMKASLLLFLLAANDNGICR